MKVGGGPWCTPDWGSLLFWSNCVVAEHELSYINKKDYQSMRSRIKKKCVETTLTLTSCWQVGGDRAGLCRTKIPSDRQVTASFLSHRGCGVHCSWRGKLHRLCQLRFSMSLRRKRVAKNTPTHNGPSNQTIVCEDDQRFGVSHIAPALLDIYTVRFS